jgi:hypothetical protein
MALTDTEKRNLTIFLQHARATVKNMANDTRYPELQLIYTRILENLNHVPINIKSGSTLEESAFGVTFGENIKRMNGPYIQSAIRIPHDHLFDHYGNIRADGALTLLHEMSHVVLPESAEYFRAGVGL